MARYESPASKLARLRAEAAAQPEALSDLEVDRMRAEGQGDFAGDWAFRGQTVDSETGPMEDARAAVDVSRNTSPEPALQSQHDYMEYYYRQDKETQAELQTQFAEGNEGDFRRAVDKHSKQGNVGEAAAATAPGTVVTTGDDVASLTAELQNLQTMDYSPAVSKRRREIAEELNKLSPAEHLEGVGVW